MVFISLVFHSISSLLHLESVVLAQHSVRVLLTMVKFFALFVFWQGHFSLFLVEIFLWIRLFLVVGFLSEIMNRDVLFVFFVRIGSRMLIFQLRSIPIIVVLLPVTWVILVIVFLGIVWVLFASWSTRFSMSLVLWRLMRVLLLSNESILLNVNFFV